MNKFVFSFLLCAFFCCETFSQQEINIQNLKECFLAKDDKHYLEQFPINFEQLNGYFGWDSDNNKPQELYDESYAYIDYWFKLLNSDKYKVYEKKIVKICTNGHWEADAIGYFQMKSRSYIKENQEYNLLNDLKDNVAKSVLFFLFDSPQPKLDADFASNLSTAKRKVLEEVFKNDLFDHDNVDDAAEVSETKGFSYYNKNDSYFVNDIDINNDGVLDKVVSHKKYQGEELLLFISKNNTYKLALKTINFSEDGGNQVVEIKKHKNGFVIVTSFLDKGFFESHYFIAYKNERWILTNTIYKTKSSNEKKSFIYVCDVKQDIDFGSSNWDNLKYMPDESSRDKKCTKEKK